MLLALRFPLSATLGAVALAALVAAPATAAPARTSREGATALRRQIDAGQVKAATIFSDRHIIHASLADKRRFSVRYRPAERHAFVAALLAHHVRFHIAASKASHHGLRRRYIALIVVAALAGLAALGYVLLRRRRGGSSAGPAAPAPR